MIVACGEALIDFVPARTSAGEAAYVPRPGGSPFNVAVTLGRLGAGAGFLGGISTDFFGASLLSALRSSGVDDRYVRRSTRPSGLAFVDLAQTEPAYVFYDREAAYRSWEPLDIGADVTMLHFGSLSLIAEPAASGLCDLMLRERPRRIVTLDPNIRPGVVGDREAAYRRRLDVMLRAAHLIKISAADLAWLEPDRPPATLAAEWLAAEALLVVVTAGPAGATAYLRDGRMLRQAADTVSMVDTVGAGDSFMGALLAGLAACNVTTPGALGAVDAATLTAVLAFAATVSAITCSRAGADPPWRDEITLPVPAGRAKGRPC